MEHTIIIGNGISGVTAARHIRKKSTQKITIISAESPYFFSRTALMYVYMGHIRFQDTQPYENSFWKKNNIDLLHARVLSIDTEMKKVNLLNGECISFTNLILASGSKPNKFGWKGQDLKGVQGLYSKQDLEAMEKNTSSIKNAVVVGGGLIGVEMAEMLLSRGIQVDYLVRDSHFWTNILPKEDADFIMKTFHHHEGLTIHYSDEIDEIIGDENGKVCALITKKGIKLQTQFVGLAVGVSPNIDFLKASNIEVNRGILVDEFLETSIPRIYAIGDCAERRNPIQNRPAVEQVWYTGKIMGETLAQTILGNKTEYQPGIWFNSAKFFDLEYQTYGNVPNKLDTEIELFSWEHEREAIRLTFAYNKTSMQFLGVNTFGIRLRHEVFDSWIKTGKTLNFVLENLMSANFDPEFYKSYEPEIIKAFNQRFNQNLTGSKKVWWQKLISKSI